jgi:hypothetical protein
MSAPVQPVGADGFATAQISVTSAATLIAAARPGRGEIQVMNTTATAVYLGGSGVTAANGHLLPGIIGASVTLKTTAAVYGIVASASATVTAAETF